ncbi:MAG TPA: NAD(P)/FAD-dependent oxidoreductase [Candidatus Magasanikbacteria bacterium]|nr:NAD(P)/FAD-dependent oxidoreductase [Candidatus Magasanikbacteria bacterium]
MKYNVIVIGGGPAGIMAAGRAREFLPRVLLLERNHNLGAKLLITGKGRCNITNYTLDVRELTKQYGKNGKFLFTAFNKFGVEDVINFFEKQGLKTKVERGNRVFPESDQAFSVLSALKKYLRDTGVEIRTLSKVEEIIKKGNKIEKIILADGEELTADKYVIATGGKSYPLTGSRGDGYEWLKKLGHKIISPKPALVPIIVKEKWVGELEGLSLKNAEISVWKKGKKIASQFGEALFTDNGMSGPIILDLSKIVGESLPEKTELKIDFKPALDEKKLDERLQKDFKEFGNKMFKNYLPELCPAKLIPIMMKLSGISPDKKVNEISREERKELLKLLKGMVLEAKSLDGYDRAIVTAGGADLSEIDPQTMQSKIIENLYIVGEVLDLDGPTGGYNLQMCWSTGFLAGSMIKEIARLQD